MVNLVVISHGDLGDGLLDAMQLIIGQQEGVRAIGLQETDPIDSLGQRVEQAIADLDTGDGVLALVDLFGASPFNVSARLVETHPQLQVVTGVNLPMLIETALQREGRSLAELAQVARQAGLDGIKSLSELLEKGDQSG